MALSVRRSQPVHALRRQDIQERQLSRSPEDGRVPGITVHLMCPKREENMYLYNPEEPPHVRLFFDAVEEFLQQSGISTFLLYSNGMPACVQKPSGGCAGSESLLICQMSVANK